jgi:hypothetical protein
MIKHILKYLLAVIALLMPVSAFSQSGGFAGVGLSLGYGPRGMAVSNAMAASTYEGIYPYYNPALAAFKYTGNQVDMSVSALDFDRVYETFGSTFQLPPNAGISIGIIRSGVKDIDERSLSGYPLGTFDLAEYQFNTTFGLRFSDRFFGGVSFKLNYANYHKELSAATAVGVDLGILYRFGDYLNFAFAVQDMFANYTWNSGELYNQSQARNVVNNFPTRLKWAFSYQREKYALQAEYELQTFGSEVNDRNVFVDINGNPVQINQLATINTSSGNIKVGGTWHAHERFSLRGGYRISDTEVSGSGSFSSGFSIHLPFDTFAPSIDYAFVTEPYGVSNIHVFALRLNL